MIAFFVNYSTVAFPLHLPTLKRQQFFGAVANSLGKNSYFPLPLDVRRCVAPTGEEVDARQRGVSYFMRNGLLEAWLATLRQNLLQFSQILQHEENDYMSRKKDLARIFKANLDSQHA